MMQPMNYSFNWITLEMQSMQHVCIKWLTAQVH